LRERVRVSVDEVRIKERRQKPAIIYSIYGERARAREI
jgi:hypothetical protein